MSKRSGQEAGQALQKRARVDDEVEGGQQMILTQDGDGKGLIQTVQRTSGLQSPIMLLAGHAAEIFDAHFDASGEHIASCSKDRTICELHMPECYDAVLICDWTVLWNVYGDCKNYGILRPTQPKTCFTALQFSPNPSSPHIFAAATDGSVYTFHAQSGQLVRRHRPSVQKVLNAIDCVKGTGRELIASAGDEGVVRVWDVEQKEALEEIEMGYPLTAVKWSLDGQQLFVGGIDNDIHCYDLRKREVVYSLRAHTDTISGLSVSPSGSHLMSASFDNTVRIWDIRPFAPVTSAAQPVPRLHRTLLGAPAGFDAALRKPAWDPSGERVAVGGADRTVTIWDVESAQIRYKLPGHKGTVTAVEFSPKAEEPIIMSASVDGQIYLGESEWPYQLTLLHPR